MNRITLREAVLLAALVVTTLPAAATAQSTDSEFPVKFSQRNMSGPRLGVSLIPGETELWQELDQKGIGRVISQFGWQFERQIVPKGGGPQFVIECVPMVAGVEYGKVVPSATLAMGVRFPSGIECGLGPNVTAVGGSEVFRSALVLAVGKSFDYGGVSLPVNLAFASNPKGQRVSLILGYAIQRSSHVPAP